jgi:hypothetical protein
MVRLRRRKPAPPCPCQCDQLAERLADAEDLNAAIVRTVVALRPRRTVDTISQGLIGWGVDPGDAALLERVYWQART